MQISCYQTVWIVLILNCHTLKNVLSFPVFVLFLNIFVEQKHCQSIFDQIKGLTNHGQPCLSTVSTEVMLTTLPTQGSQALSFDKNKSLFLFVSTSFVSNCTFSDCYNLIVSRVDFSPSVIFCSSLYSADYQIAFPLSEFQEEIAGFKSL